MLYFKGEYRKAAPDLPYADYVQSTLSESFPKQPTRYTVKQKYFSKNRLHKDINIVRYRKEKNDYNFNTPVVQCSFAVTTCLFH